MNLTKHVKQTSKSLGQFQFRKLFSTKKGMHPHFGEVTLRQLLATWTIHDLSHIAQISRVMTKQYKEEVGPWLEYMNILTK